MWNETLVSVWVSMLTSVLLVVVAIASCTNEKKMRKGTAKSVGSMQMAELDNFQQSPPKSPKKQKEEPRNPGSVQSSLDILQPKQAHAVRPFAEVEKERVEKNNADYQTVPPPSDWLETYYNYSIQKPSPPSKLSPAPPH
jgi:hypothetical protein